MTSLPRSPGNTCARLQSRAAEAAAHELRATVEEAVRATCLGNSRCKKLDWISWWGKHTHVQPKDLTWTTPHVQPTSSKCKVLFSDCQQNAACSTNKFKVLCVNYLNTPHGRPTKSRYCLSIPWTTPHAQQVQGVVCFLLGSTRCSNIKFNIPFCYLPPTSSKVLVVDSRQKTLVPPTSSRCCVWITWKTPYAQPESSRYCVLITWKTPHAQPTSSRLNTKIHAVQLQRARVGAARSPGSTSKVLASGMVGWGVVGGRVVGGFPGEWHGGESCLGLSESAESARSHPVLTRGSGPVGSTNGTGQPITPANRLPKTLSPPPSQAVKVVLEHSWPYLLASCQPRITHLTRGPRMRLGWDHPPRHLRWRKYPLCSITICLAPNFELRFFALGNISHAAFG